MNQLKAYKYRLYPTKYQAKYLDNVFGSVRFVWNKLVENFNSYSSVGPNQLVTEKTLKDTPEYSWLQETISYALQQKRNDFIEYKKQYFNKKRKKKLGKPNFKKKGVSRDSFRIPAASMNLTSFNEISEGKIKLPKMQPMKIIIDKEFEGKPRNVTVSKNKSGQYFVSILVEEDIELKQNTGRAIGIDLGLNDLCIMSNGMKISNPRFLRNSQSKIKKAQRHLSRKKKGSNRHEKQRIKVAKLHQKVANQRQWLYHNITTALVTDYDEIFVENLNVSGMIKGTCSASISDVSWSILLGMLEYKCRWYGKSFHKIDRFFPSSKTCSCCGIKIMTCSEEIENGLVLNAIQFMIEI